MDGLSFAQTLRRQPAGEPETAGLRRERGIPYDYARMYTCGQNYQFAQANWEALGAAAPCPLDLTRHRYAPIYGYDTYRPCALAPSRSTPCSRSDAPAQSSPSHACHGTDAPHPGSNSGTAASPFDAPAPEWGCEANNSAGDKSPRHAGRLAISRSTKAPEEPQLRCGSPWGSLKVRLPTAPPQSPPSQRPSGQHHGRLPSSPVGSHDDASPDSGSCGGSFRSLCRSSGSTSSSTSSRSSSCGAHWSCTRGAHCGCAIGAWGSCRCSRAGDDCGTGEAYAADGRRGGGSDGTGAAKVLLAALGPAAPVRGAGWGSRHGGSRAAAAAGGEGHPPPTSAAKAPLHAPQASVVYSSGGGARALGGAQAVAPGGDSGSDDSACGDGTAAEGAGAAAPLSDIAGVRAGAVPVPAPPPSEAPAPPPPCQQQQLQHHPALELLHAAAATGTAATPLAEPRRSPGPPASPPQPKPPPQPPQEPPLGPCAAGEGSIDAHGPGPPVPGPSVPGPWYANPWHSPALSTHAAPHPLPAILEPHDYYFLAELMAHTVVAAAPPPPPPRTSAAAAAAPPHPGTPDACGRVDKAPRDPWPPPELGARGSGTRSSSSSSNGGAGRRAGAGGGVGSWWGRAVAGLRPGRWPWWDGGTAARAEEQVVAAAAGAQGEQGPAAAGERGRAAGAQEREAPAVPGASEGMEPQAEAVAAAAASGGEPTPSVSPVNALGVPGTALLSAAAAAAPTDAIVPPPACAVLHAPARRRRGSVGCGRCGGRAGAQTSLDLLRELERQWSTICAMQ